MSMNKAVGFIVHRDEETREETAWGIVYADGSVKWYDSMEEAEYYYPEENNQ